MLLILLTIILLCFTYLLIRTYYNHLNYWSKRGVLCEKPHYLFGNLKELEESKNLSTIHNEFYKKYKPSNNYLGFFFYLKPAFVVFDLDVAKNILIRDFSNFTSKFRYLNERHDPLTATLLNLQGAKWQQLRKDLTVAFTPRKVKASFQRVYEEATKLGDYIETSHRKEDEFVVDVRELIVRHITNIASRFCLGIDSNSLESDVFYHKALDILGSSTNFYIKIARALICSFPRFFAKFRIKIISKDMDRFLMNTVREVLKIREDNVDFMSVFLRMRNVTVEKISAQVYSLSEATLATTSTTLCMILYELALNEDIQEKLRMEIFEFFDDIQGDCNYANIKECQYLQQVIYGNFKFRLSSKSLCYLFF